MVEETIRNSERVSYLPPSPEFLTFFIEGLGAFTVNNLRC